MKTNNRYQISSIEQELTMVDAVFTDKVEAAECVKELKKSNVETHITVTGISEHDYSVSIRGKLSKLPEEEILEITTMCGHGMISQYLVRDILLDMKRGRRTSQEAAEYLSTPCICGVFNPKRAQRLLEELVEIWCFDEN